MAFWGICFQIIILKSIEIFVNIKFQITYQIITVLITFLRSDVISIICNVRIEVNKKQITNINIK